MRRASAQPPAPLCRFWRRGQSRKDPECLRVGLPDLWGGALPVPVLGAAPSQPGVLIVLSCGRHGSAVEERAYLVVCYNLI